MKRTAIFTIIIWSGPAAVLAYAQAVSPAASVMTNNASSGTQAFGEWTVALLLGFYVPRVMQWLKRSDWFPFLKAGEFWLNRTFAIGVSVVSAIGVHATFTRSDQGWDAHLWGPQLSLMALAIDVLRQFAMQEYFFQSKEGSRRPDSAQA